MAVALSCRCCDAKVMGSGSTVHVRALSPAGVESAVPSAETTGAAPLSISRMQSKEKLVSDSPASGGISRLATMAAAAAASIAVLSATPGAVLAGNLERGISGGPLSTHSIPGDLSLSIAIPIPDPDTWTNSQAGFLAPPPRSGGSRGAGMVMLTYQGGCPAWQPSQFEMIVPDGVHSKRISRHGGQWLAVYQQEQEATTTQQQPAVDPADPNVQYESIIDTLLRMSDSGLTCFSL